MPHIDNYSIILFNVYGKVTAPVRRDEKNSCMREK